jgi:hypothetical protein
MDEFQRDMTSYLNMQKHELIQLVNQLNLGGRRNVERLNAVDARVILMEHAMSKHRVRVDDDDLQKRVEAVVQLAERLDDVVSKRVGDCESTAAAVRTAMERVMQEPNPSVSTFDELRALAVRDESAKAALEKARAQHLLAKEVLSLVPSAKACKNCDECNARGLTCEECDARACSACLAEAVHSSCARDPPEDGFGASCFSCAAAFKLVDVVSVLATSHAEQAMELVQAHANKAAFEERITCLAKRKGRKTLGEETVALMVDPLTCHKCDTPIFLGLYCMHMDCTVCGLKMCGFCLSPSSECESWMCELNPDRYASNDSSNKNKSELVIRAARIASLLSCVPSAERAAALAVAAEAFAASSVPGAGCLDPDEPWLFREEPPKPGEEPYISSVLRAHLHNAWRGKHGADAPPVNYGDVRCGDAVTLVDQDVLVDANFVEGISRANMAAKTFAVVSVEACEVSICSGINWATDRATTLQWEAVASTVRARDVLTLGENASPNPEPHVGGYVLVVDDEASLRVEPNFEPSMLSLVGTWAPVMAVGREGNITVRTVSGNHLLSGNCIRGFVAAEVAVARLGF